MAKVYAVANDKGGVGRTTTVVTLAREIARARNSVLVIDIDPQANATVALGVDANEVITLANVLDYPRRYRLSDAVTPTSWDVDVVAAEDVQAVWASPNAPADPRPLLRPLIDTLRENYDVILLDCPPMMNNSLTLAAMTAADAVVIVTTPDMFALRGLARTRVTIDEIRSHASARLANPSLYLAGVIVTMHDDTTTSAAYLSELREVFDDEGEEGTLWEPPLRRAVFAREVLATASPVDELIQEQRFRHAEPAQRFAADTTTLAERMLTHE